MEQRQLISKRNGILTIGGRDHRHRRTIKPEPKPPAGLVPVASISEHVAARLSCHHHKWRERILPARSIALRYFTSLSEKFSEISSALLIQSFTRPGIRVENDLP